MRSKERITETPHESRRDGMFPFSRSVQPVDDGNMSSFRDSLRGGREWLSCYTHAVPTEPSSPNLI